MKTSLLSVTIAAVLAGSLSPAYATTPVQPTTHEQDQKPKTDRKRLFKAGGIGCVTGALTGFLAGKKKGAIAGCVVGGAIGSVASYRQQMTEARELATQAQSAGMTAQVSTKQVTATTGEQVESLDQVVIAYSPASMIARDAKTLAVLDRIAALAKKSKSSLTITAEGRDNKACQIPLAELSARGAFPPATAVDKCGAGQARLLISPVPDLT